MTPEAERELAAFLDGSIDPASFDHAAHVRVAKRILEGHDFLEAAWIYGRSLERITRRAGQEDKLSVTKTVAFLSLIAEGGEEPDKGALSKWYSQERLEDPAARSRFLMPDGFRQKD